MNHVTAISGVSYFTCECSFKSKPKKLALETKTKAVFEFGMRMYADGRIYKGSLLNGQRHGLGLEVSPYSSLYEGDFKNDKPNGFGTYYHEGMRYIGDFVNGRIVKGYVFDDDKLIFFGSFANESSLPKGTYYLGQMDFHGSFVEGRPHGLGSLISRISGCVYKGMYHNGWRVGSGELTYPNGSVYSGDFNEVSFPFMPIPHGVGKLKNKDANAFIGHFLNGYLVSKAITSKRPRI